MLYEISILAKKETAFESVDKLIEKAIKSVGGEIKSVEDFGVKNLAFNIGDESKARYIFYDAELPDRSAMKLYSKFNLEKDILRYLIVKVGERSEDDRKN